MAPVPPGHFTNRDELLDHAKTWAKEQGYAIVTSRSRPNRIWLKCDRGGHYENRRNLTADQRKRKRGESRLLGCPFQAIGAQDKSGGWKLKTENGEHNHEPSQDLSAHPSLRKMTAEQMARLAEMTDAGSSPAEIMVELQNTWPEINVIKRDIYNARKKYKSQRETGVATPGSLEIESWDDSNAPFPSGPIQTGKWVWPEDGDEIITKGNDTDNSNKRKKKMVAPTPAMQPSNLDPQLRNAGPPPPPSPHVPNSVDGAHHLSSQTMQTFYPDQSVVLSDSSLTPPLDRHNSAPPSPHQQQHPSSSYAQQSVVTDSPSPSASYAQRNSQVGLHYAQHDPLQPSPRHWRQQSSLSSIQQLDGAADGQILSGEDGGAQFLVSHIEQMAKEQRDQKDMLARILGAVEGIPHTDNG